MGYVNFVDMIELNIILSWIIIFIGTGLLSCSPIRIYKKIRVGRDNSKDRKLTDRMMLLLYYEIAGIVIMVLGVLLVLSFSDKLPNLII